MKKRWRGVAGILLLALGCESTKRTVMATAPEKPYPCDLDVFWKEEDVKRPFIKLCAIHVDDKAAFGASAIAEAKEKVDKQACKCGADALIIKGHYGNEEGKWWVHQVGHEVVDAIAIRYSDR